MWVQPNTSVVRAIARGQWQAPLGSSRPTTRSRAACRRARVRQGQAFGGAEEAPSLTAAARDGDGGSNKARQKWRDAPLTKKVPYKPYAGKPPVRFCAGGAMKIASLPLRAPAASWCDPAGGSPAQVRSSARLVASVARPLATVVAKRTQRLHGVWD